MANLTRRSVGLLGSAALLGASLSPGALAQTVPAKNRVVFQVSDADPSKWNLALNNARNVQSEFPDDPPDLEIVVYGPGIGMLKKDSPVAQRIAEAIKSGVKVVACENTMHGMKLTYADMLTTIGFVPAGVVEIMRKQQQGYAYIRP